MRNDVSKPMIRTNDQAQMNLWEHAGRPGTILYDISRKKSKVEEQQNLHSTLKWSCGQRSETSFDCAQALEAKFQLN